MAESLAASGALNLLGQLFGGDLGLGPVLLLGAVLLGIGLIVLLIRRPDLLFRLVLWLPAHLLYRIRVYGRENVPTQGPVLFVCNHVSYLDAVLVFLAQRRPVHFMVWTPYTQMFGLRLLFKLARVIPIDNTAGPRAILRALRMAGEVLEQGKTVCIFAEGGITRTGLLLPFQRGLEQILKRRPVPVVPVCLDHVWGSIFSYRGGRFFWKWPQKLPYPVSVGFGKPLPATVTAFEVRQAIQKLSADISVARQDLRLPVHREFLHRAVRHPFRPCLVDALNRGKVLRYGEVLAGAHLLAGLLRPLLADDRMVGVWLPPSVGGAFANIALAFLGRVAVNLNYTLSERINQAAAQQCDLRRVLTSRQFLARMPLNLPGVELIYLEDLRGQISNGQRVRAFLMVLLLPAFVLDRWVLKLGSHRPQDLATVIFSSGSTGDPKGVMLSHRNLSANTESVIQAIDPRASDRILGILPFFHSFGYTVTLWVPLQVGASMVYHADPRQAKETGELCRTYRCTILLTTPTFLRFNLRRCQPGDFRTLRILICGAEKMPPSLAQEFQEKFGIQVLEGYGCTELSPVAACNVPDWHEGNLRQLGNKPGTIGQPIPGVAARVVNPENFQALPANQEGLLLFYGGNVMEGYLGKPELTRAAMHEGWYITGDMGKIDDDGFITITGRLARFSKIGGEMVPHQKIEEELHAILGTSERVCVVTAVPDERRGERLVVLHTPLNGLNRHHLSEELGTKGLPNLWIPSERDFIEVSELPILGSGKLDLKRVKEMALERTQA